MTSGTSYWEHSLLERSCQALNGWTPTKHIEPAAQHLAAAYRYCANATRRYSRTFYLASGLLPRAKRMAVRALYAFCRVGNDIVDRHQGDGRTARQQLEAWRRQILAPGQSGDPIIHA